MTTMSGKSLPVIKLDGNEISLLYEQYKQALTLFETNQPGTLTELEWRVGIPSKLKNEKGQFSWEYSSNIDKNLFFSTKNRLDEIVKPSQSSSIITIKESADSRIRKIESDQKIEFQSKQSISKSTIYCVSQEQVTNLHDRNVYGLRLNLSTEKQLTLNNPEVKLFEANSEGQKIKKRVRTRYSYDFDTHTIELTIITDQGQTSHEIELEYSSSFLKSMSGSKNDKPNMLTKFLSPIKQLLSYIFPESTTITAITTVISQYTELIRAASFFNGKFHSPPRPVNIEIDQVPLLLGGYSWTNKLNGTKYHILNSPFLTKYALFLFNDTDIKFICYLNKDVPHEILLDAELFFWNNKWELHVFDRLTKENGSAITNKSHLERLEGVDTYINTLNSAITNTNNSIPLAFHIKQFFYSPHTVNPVENIQKVIEYSKRNYGDKYQEANDGIIMTPEAKYIINGAEVTKSYFEPYFPTFKWKDPVHVSIDFILGKGAERTLPTEKISKFVTIPSSYKEKSIQVKEFSIGVYSYPTHKKFEKYVDRGKQYTPPQVLIIPSTHPEYNLVNTDKIVEVVWNRQTSQFSLLRIREDKTTANAVHTAQKTFIDMIDEFSLDLLNKLTNSSYIAFQKGQDQVVQVQVFENSYDITIGKNAKYPLVSPSKVYAPKTREQILASLTEQQSQVPNPSCEKYRKFNNGIKRAIIDKYCPKKNVVDLGSGKGGDLGKYFPEQSESQVAFLWAVEPDIEKIKSTKGAQDDFTSRLSRYSPSIQSRVKIINKKAEDSALLREIDTVKHANVVSSFMSLSFFFRDDKVLNSFIDNVSNFLVNGGHFIGTFMDGEAVYDLLAKNKGKYESECAKIFSDYEGNIGIGKQIRIILPGAVTVENEQVEWLVPFNILVDRLERRGLKLVEGTDKFFSEYPNFDSLPKEVQTLVGLYRTFVFKREILHDINERRKDIVKNSLNALGIDSREEGQFISSELYKDTLYRSGVLGAGSCMIHSLLWLIDHPEYTNLEISKNERQLVRSKLVTEIRNILADNLTHETFSKLSDGTLEKLRLQMEIIEKIKEIPPEIGKKVITEERLMEIIDATSLTNLDNNDWVDSLIKQLTIEGYDESILKQFITSLRENIYKRFQNSLKDCRAFLGFDAIEYVMQALNINIFIIYDSTRLPAKSVSGKLYKEDRPSVLLLNLEGQKFARANESIDVSIGHFEPLFDIVGNNVDSANIQCIFPSNHPLIKALVTYIDEAK